MLIQRAQELLKKFKGDSYVFGLDVLDQVGQLTAQAGTDALVVANRGHLEKPLEQILASLAEHGVELAGGSVRPGVGANTPREDVYRLKEDLLKFNPSVLLAIGGGSTIDGVKAANALASLDLEVDNLFGTGLVTAALKESGQSLRPLVAVQTVSSSAAHLTKYANVTDPVSAQKKLIVDEALTPQQAVFDYAVTTSMPLALTIDGALDGLAHCLEVFYGISDHNYALVQEITEVALELIFVHTKRALKDPLDLKAREALGLATDLGGYAIMVGGTNGAHLTSFSLVDVASHGRACGIMNPYYTVFFAPAIERQLLVVGEILRKTGYLTQQLQGLKGGDLGLAVAQGLVSFAQDSGAPTTLAELPGFGPEHLEQALQAAKDPQLEMKLQNMPIPLDSSLVDEYLRPVLTAAQMGDFGLIKAFKS